MNRKSLLAILVCIVFYMFYSQYLAKKYPPPPKNTQPQQEKNPSKQNSTIAQTDSNEDPFAAPKQAEYQKLNKEQLYFSNPEVSFQYNQEIGGFSSIKLHNYRLTADPDSELIELTPNTLQINSTIGNDTGAGKYVNAQRTGRTLLVWYKKDGWLISQEFGFPQRGYGLDILFTFKNIAGKDKELDTAISLTERIDYALKSSFLPGLPTNRPTILRQVLGETDWEDLQEYCTDGEEDDDPRLVNSSIEIMGFDRHYFLSAFLLDDMRNADYKALVLAREQGDCEIRLTANQRQGLMSPQEEVRIVARAYFGPKLLGELEEFDPRLGKTLDLGWFSLISHALLRAIKWLYGFVGNYGLAIILLTIFIKILFYPLTRQSAISMHKMKKLQPQMNEIRSRYKGNPREQQMRLMQFMREHKVNPMKGCLPFLPQIPVFFAFYRVLSASVELRHAPFFGWIIDLSAKDPYYVAPVLMGFSIFLQQKLTPMTGMDKSQQRIMLMMPVIFSVMMLSMPAGVVVYVLTQTIVSVSQQQWITRRLSKETEGK